MKDKDWCYSCGAQEVNPMNGVCENCGADFCFGEDSDDEYYDPDLDDMYEEPLD